MTIKFTALSPKTTQLLRARTELQQREGKVKVGRTVFTYHGDPGEFDRLLDWLILSEIPGAGANSREVKRLRELRRFLRAARGPEISEEQQADAAHVTITADQAADRDRVLDLIDRLWRAAADLPAANELTDLAEAAGGPGVDYRAWLAKVL